MEKDKRLGRARSDGGRRLMREAACVELHERVGPGKYERSTAAGGKTTAGPLFDRRAKLSERQKAVGITYGHFFEQLTKPGSSEWITEFVDRSIGPSAGPLGNMERIAMVEIARARMREAPDLVFRSRKARSRVLRGPHHPIPMLTLLDLVCVEGMAIMAIAMASGWYIRHDHAERGQERRLGRPTVPNRQHEKVSVAVSWMLDAVGEAWEDRSYEPLNGALGVVAL